MKEFAELVARLCEIGPDRWCQVRELKLALGKEYSVDALERLGFAQSRGRRVDGAEARTWEGLSVRRNAA